MSNLVVIHTAILKLTLRIESLSPKHTPVGHGLLAVSFLLVVYPLRGRTDTRSPIHLLVPDTLEAVRNYYRCKICVCVCVCGGGDFFLLVQIIIL